MGAAAEDTSTALTITTHIGDSGPLLFAGQQAESLAHLHTPHRDGGKTPPPHRRQRHPEFRHGEPPDSHPLPFAGSAPASPATRATEDTAAAKPAQLDADENAAVKRPQTR